MEILAQVETRKKATKDFEATMRVKASTVGNIVGSKVPVSMTEVCDQDPSVLRHIHMDKFYRMITLF